MNRIAKAARAGSRLTFRKPIIWVFGFVASIGGIGNIVRIIYQDVIHGILLQLWFRASGVSAVPRIIAVIIGLSAGIYALLLFAGWATAIILMIVAREHYAEPISWTKIIKSSAKSFWTMGLSFLLYYLASAAWFALIFALIGWTNPGLAYATLLGKTIVFAGSLLFIAVLAAFSAIAFFQQGFMAIFGMRFWMALRSAIELFFEHVFGTLSMILYIAMALLLAGGAVLLVLFLIVSAILRLSGGALPQGLLLTGVTGILVLFNVGCTVFFDSALGIYFLEIVSARRAPAAKGEQPATPQVYGQLAQW